MQHQVFFTPGPSQLYYTVGDHIKTALNENVGSISHRSKAFQKIYAETVENLKALLELPEGYHIFFTSSANEIWERIIQNLVDHQSHHFVNGAFSKKFLEFALAYQKKAYSTEVANGCSFEAFKIKQDAELIAITLNETSIGFQFDQKVIKDLRNSHPEALIAIDGVSAFPALPFDFSLADTAYFSVQKCFGLPAGLGVWIVNDRAIAKAKALESQGRITGSYHRLSELIARGEKNQTPETPNVFAIYLLGKVAADLQFRGIKQIQNETAYKSAVLYQGLEASKSLSPFVKEKKNRSKTVIVAESERSITGLIEDASKQGWLLGSGYGSYKENHIRIANFPVHSKEQIEQIADFLSSY